MNITLSADKNLVERARAYAADHGTSVNQLIRDYLEQLVGGMSAEDAAAEFASIARNQAGRSDGSPFRREDIYAERMNSLTRAYDAADDGGRNR